MMERRIHDFLPEIKDYYTITEDGKVYSDRTGEMKTRNKGKTEYLIINFQKIDGLKKTYRLHRLVMMAFNPVKDMDKLEVNHIDGNKLNNKLSNLEWCTSSLNLQHAFNTGLLKPKRGEKSNFAKLTKKDIEQVFLLRRQGKLQREIADIMGCTRSNISYILNQKSWQE